MGEGRGPQKPRKARKSRSKRRRPPGRPPHVPDTRSRAQVEALVAIGRNQDEIAEFFNITGKTLRRHYPRELATGNTKALLNVGVSLHDMAVGRPAQYDADRNRLRAELPAVPAAAIFWMKARAGWRETVDVDNAKDGNGNPVPFRITRRDEKL